MGFFDTQFVQNFLCRKHGEADDIPRWPRVRQGSPSYPQSRRHKRLPPASLPSSSSSLCLSSLQNLTRHHYTLRRAYYSTASGGEEFDFGLDRTHHTGHCFEYLRKSIMCTADSTLEPAKDAKQGLLGWGFRRLCRSN